VGRTLGNLVISAISLIFVDLVIIMY